MSDVENTWYVKWADERAEKRRAQDRVLDLEGVLLDIAEIDLPWGEQQTESYRKLEDAIKKAARVLP
jgi:hypothetical protein